MIQQIESNDMGFTEIWSSATKMDCGTLFSNPQLSNDIFFDKLTGVTCLSEEMIDQSIVHFKQIHSVPYVYSLNYPEFERVLEKKGFVYHDTQHVLKKSVLPQKKTNAIQITRNNIALWVDVFCKAYDCPEWAKPVNTILENSLQSVGYFVDQSGGSCMALYEKNSVLGLYCLGTVPDRRNRGLAASLIDFALNEARSRHLESLILETYERDSLMEFYSNLGFENVYHKKVFTI
jgi:GNAT superfamily N-acetyltransferase